jgi:beta-lactamase regulating signal transducer with metallopeptidase domain
VTFWTLAEYALESTAVLVLCWAATGLMRRSSAALRHATWTAGFALVLLLGPLSLVTPAVSVAPPGAVPPSAATSDAGARARSVADASRAEAVDTPPKTAGARSTQAGPATNRATPARRAPQELAVGMARALPWAWLAGAMLALLRVVVSRIRLGRLRRRSRPIDDARVLAAADEARRKLGLTARFELCWSPDVASPAVFGVARATVVLPDDAGAWPAERLRVVLTHELSHVQRRDPLAQLVAELARAVHWYHPLARHAFDRCMLERERACDDRVVEDGVDGIDCAEHLVAIARLHAEGGPLPGAALTMSNARDLAARVTSLLEPSSPRSPITRRQLGVLGVHGLVAAAVLACVGIRPGTAIGHGSHAAPRAVQPASSPPLAPTSRPTLSRTDDASRATGPTEPVMNADAPVTLTDARIDIETSAMTATTTSELALPAPDHPSSERVEIENPRAHWPSSAEIASSPERAAIERLLAAAEHEKSWEWDLVRERAEWALTRVRDGRIVAPLVASLSDADWRIQAYAAWALAITGATSAGDALEPLLDHSVWRVRAQAATSLLALGHALPREAIVRLARDPAWQVRLTIVDALRQQGDADARDLLLEMRHDPHTGTRLQVEIALSELALR